MSPHSGEQVRRQCIHHNVSSRSATQQKPRGAASPTSGDGPGSQPHRQIESRVAEAKGNASTIRGPHVMLAARPCPGSPDRPENGPRSRLLPTDGSDCRSRAGATPTQPSCIASYNDLENTLGSLAFIRHPSHRFYLVQLRPSLVIRASDSSPQHPPRPVMPRATALHTSPPARSQQQTTPGAVAFHLSQSASRTRTRARPPPPPPSQKACHRWGYGPSIIDRRPW